MKAGDYKRIQQHGELEEMERQRVLMLANYPADIHDLH